MDNDGGGDDNEATVLALTIVLAIFEAMVDVEVVMGKR